MYATILFFQRYIHIAYTILFKSYISCLLQNEYAQVELTVMS